MSTIASIRTEPASPRHWLITLALAAGAGATIQSSSFAQAAEKIPELASSSFAWLAFGAEWRDPPAPLRGPIKNDPDHPYHGNLDTTGQVTVRMGNYKDPILKPW